MIADLHACEPWMSMARVEAILAQAQDLGGDLIALMGDYPGHLPFARAIPPERIAAALSRLAAPLGTFAIFGNHDWKDDPAARRARAGRTLWHDALEAAGVTTLVNRSLTLAHDGHPIRLAGIDSQRAFLRKFPRRTGGAHDLAAALADTPERPFTILLAHEPDIFPSLPAAVDLTLSGHTHGGQIRLFGRPWLVPSDHGRRYAYGHHEAEGRHLVVSGGLGCSGLPFRYAMPPELTVVELA